MGTSAPVPPGDGDVSEDDDLEDLEMTSVMDGAQARELRRAARIAVEAERETARIAGEAERETARPPPPAAVIMEAEVSIPRAPALPVEDFDTPVPGPATQGASSTRDEAQGAGTPAPWVVLAFVLLAAAIAFELR